MSNPNKNQIYPKDKYYNSNSSNYEKEKNKKIKHKEKNKKNINKNKNNKASGKKELNAKDKEAEEIIEFKKLMRKEDFNIEYISEDEEIKYNCKSYDLDEEIKNIPLFQLSEYKNDKNYTK